MYFFIFPTTAYLYIQYSGVGKKTEEDGDENEKQKLLGDTNNANDVVSVETKEDGGFSQDLRDSKIYVGDIDQGKDFDEEDREKEEEYNNTLFYLTLAVCWLDFNNWGLIQVCMLVYEHLHRSYSSHVYIRLIM